MRRGLWSSARAHSKHLFSRSHLSRFSASFSTFRPSAERPKNVGIIAMDTYFPRNYVAQSDLEKHDGVSEGKYTIGLGQNNMAFCGPNEDINSICLSVVDSLLTKYEIDPKDIGRLEVGTETIVDKSKSVKTILLDLFQSSGNSNIEGIDTTNACYGGTNALFNALHWIESQYYDGRYALVVAADIAVYEKGPARPTGGAGAVAMLLGPNAPIVFEPVRATHMENAWDFYKPTLSSEYPTVDGQLSNDCYLRALDRCFTGYSKCFNSRQILASSAFGLKDFDYAIFHSPYSKLVQKSWARMHYLDYLNSRELYPQSKLGAFASKKPEETYNDKDLMKVSMDETKESYASKVKPSLLLGLELGNSYCASLYCGLQSLIETKASDLANKRVAFFSYGSGLAATLFSAKVTGDVTEISKTANVKERLKSRVKSTPAEFEEALLQREKTHNLAPYTPPNAADVFPGAYYLKGLDSLRRRSYAKA